VFAFPCGAPRVLELRPFDPPRTGIAVLVKPAHALTRHRHGTVQNIVLAKLSRRNVRRGKRRNFMKQFFGVGLGMLAGVAIGALAVSGLHAQGKPSVYLVTEIDVTDPDNYAKEFAPKAQATIKSAGGRFVVIGGVAGVGAKSACDCKCARLAIHSALLARTLKRMVVEGRYGFASALGRPSRSRSNHS
jgi:uncharacterized protein DUF1330